LSSDGKYTYTISVDPEDLLKIESSIMQLEALTSSFAEGDGPNTEQKDDMRELILRVQGMAGVGNAGLSELDRDKLEEIVRISGQIKNETTSLLTHLGIGSTGEHDLGEYLEGAGLHDVSLTKLGEDMAVVSNAFKGGGFDPQRGRDAMVEAGASNIEISLATASINEISKMITATDIFDRVDAAISMENLTAENMFPAHLEEGLSKALTRIPELKNVISTAEASIAKLQKDETTIREDDPEAADKLININALITDLKATVSDNKRELTSINRGLHLRFKSLDRIGLPVVRTAFGEANVPGGLQEPMVDAIQSYFKSIQEDPTPLLGEANPLGTAMMNVFDILRGKEEGAEIAGLEDFSGMLTGEIAGLIEKFLSARDDPASTAGDVNSSLVGTILTPMGSHVGRGIPITKPIVEGPADIRDMGLAVEHMGRELISGVRSIIEPAVETGTPTEKQTELIELAKGITQVGDRMLEVADKLDAQSNILQSIQNKPDPVRTGSEI